MYYAIIVIGKDGMAMPLATENESLLQHIRTDVLKIRAQHLHQIFRKTIKHCVKLNLPFDQDRLTRVLRILERSHARLRNPDQYDYLNYDWSDD